jgi:diguanylate cyclase (GGDEF)-like protein
MDFQSVADSIGALTCVISVEKLENGGHGAIRIVTGNRAYIDSIEHPAPGTEMLTTHFVPNSEYTRYLTRDLNFEDYCYRAAVEKKCLHSYAHPDRIDAWFNMTFMPLVPDEGNLCYCTYTMEISFEPSTERMSNVSGDLASAVLETSLKLSGARDFPAAMGEVIKDVRALCESNHCYILLMNTRRRTCRVLCYDAADPATVPPTEYMESSEFYEIAERWNEAISGSNCLVVKNAQDMEVVKERNPRWHATLVTTGIRTLVLFPLKNQKELLGYIWATNFDPKKAGRIKETLELTTFVLSTQIANYLMMQQLRIMGELDMLTGVNNRNRMNDRVARFQDGTAGAGEMLGIVFADLNGLKTVNDTEGHNAGDALLRDAADALREVFSEEEIYRAGGDEFTMILPGAAEAELEEKAAELREASEKYHRLSFAIGCCAVPDGRDILTALHTADERMYDDKRRYYATHPERERRAR